MMSWGQFPSYNTLAKYAAPRGWTGQWPPPAPPHQQPPMPEGMNMDPRRWQSGQWHFNTAFNFGAPAQAEWAPHPAWGGPAAADFNPYKRVAKRGDAEYYKQPLSANPLGLTDMIPAEQLQEKQKPPEQPAALRTPWFWAPNELVAEDAPPAGGEQSSQRPQQHKHHRHRSNSEHTRAPDQWASSQQQASSRVGGRAAGEDAPNNTDGYHAPPSSASAAISSFAQYGDQQQQQQQQRGYGPDSERRHSSDTNGSSASTQARSHTLDSAPAWSSRSDLRPTFSPKIVRTPDSYLGSSSASAAAAAAAATSSSRDSRRASEGDSTPKPSRRRSSKEDPRLSHSASRRSSREGRSRDSPSTKKHRHRDSSSSDGSPPPGPRTHGRIYGPPTPTSARTQSDGTTSSTQPSLSSLSGSMGSLSVSDPSAPTSSTSQNFLLQPFFSDEPVDLLSPLLVSAVPPRTPERSGKELSRSQTYPNFPSSGHTSPFPPIPEEPPSSTGGRLSRTPSSKTPKRSPSHHSPRTPKSLGRSRTYPNLNNGDVSPVVPPRPETYSPPRFPSAFNNPLPTPPKEITSSASTSIASQSYHTPTRTSSQDRYPADTHSRAQSYSSTHPSSSASQAQYMSSASTAAHQQQQHQQQQHQQQQYQQQQQPQYQPPVTKRYGYWNRRGDHLVVGGTKYATSADDQKDTHYIVYVPREQANPDDLAGYPAPTAGWMDHRGRTIKYDPNTPELPESLPRRGEPPTRPYQSFLQYITV